MHKELKLTKNLRIGIDTDAIGIAIGLIRDPLIKVKGIMLLGLYIAWRSSRLKGKKIKEFTVIDRTFVKHNDKFYTPIPHPELNLKVLYVRERQSNTIVEYDNCTIIKNPGFQGALVYKPYSHKPEFYSTDEYYFFDINAKVKGYIDGNAIQVLSIVD